MQHDPNRTGLVEAKLDEMITSTQRTKLIYAHVETRALVFFNDGFVSRLQGQPSVHRASGWFAPRPTVIFATVVGAAVWHCSFDRRA